MREKLENLPGIAVLFTTPLGMRIDDGLGGTPADLSVRIFGPDLDRLAKLAAEARSSWSPSCCCTARRPNGPSRSC
jgi:cobalt-zinc-cadmium resistance protein CzcA